MKVYVNGRFLTQRITGMQRFAVQVLNALDELLIEGHELTRGVEFEVLVPSQERNPVDFKRIVINSGGSLKGHLWEQIDLPRLTFGHPLVNLCGTGPVAKRRQLVVIHDVAPLAEPTGFSSKFRMMFKVIVPVLARVSAEVVTVSEFSRMEMARLLRIPEDRISVLAEGVDHIDAIKMASDLPTELEHKRFILTVSSLNPNKNFRSALEAFSGIDNREVVLAIAGGSNPKVFSSDFVQPATDDSVVWLGYVSDEKLKRLYTEAECFVFPSLYEGFGLPPLEAMACGCPVASSNAASMPEVLGDAARYFDPLDVPEMTAVINQVIADESLRASMRESGKQRAAQYRWRDAAIALLKRVQVLR